MMFEAVIHQVIIIPNPIEGRNVFADYLQMILANHIISIQVGNVFTGCIFYSGITHSRTECRLLFNLNEFNKLMPGVMLIKKQLGSHTSISNNDYFKVFERLA